MAVVNFNGFSLAVYCIFVICHKKLSMPRMTLWFIFSTWHVGFCHGRVVDTYFVVFVVALLFYVHGKHLSLCRDGQLT